MRPSRDEYFMMMAFLAASRSTCLRRKVGCILVNERGNVVATGYNGVAAGQSHCNEGFPCEAALAPSGTKLDGCEAIHAEQNALLQCKDVQSIYTCYCTASPCITCTKLLLNTSCKRVIFGEEYPHQRARELWITSGRDWTLGEINVQTLGIK